MSQFVSGWYKVSKYGRTHLFHYKYAMIYTKITLCHDKHTHKEVEYQANFFYGYHMMDGNTVSFDSKDQDHMRKIWEDHIDNAFITKRLPCKIQDY